LHQKVQTTICPTCGCSLVRLGTEDKSNTYIYNGVPYDFCCKGCLELFIIEPDKYITEINNVVVCPTCLGEKRIGSTTKLVYAEMEFYFCRCPHCIKAFERNPDYFINRLKANAC